MIEKFDSHSERTNLVFYNLTVEQMPPRKEFSLNLQPLTPKFIHEGSVLNALNSTRIGRFYRAYLRHFNFLHKRITIPLYWQLRTLYIKCRSMYQPGHELQQINPWFPLVKLQDYITSRNIAVIKLLDSSRVIIERPSVYPLADRTLVSQPCDQYEFPSIYCAKLSNAILYGGSNLIYNSDGAICHDLLDVDTDYTPEEMHGRVYINVKKRIIRRIHFDKNSQLVDVAASFLDGCSTNYAHWITEVLPRIAAFCTLKHFSHIPIMIDAGLHENILESLSMIVGSARKIITVPPGNSVCVRELFVTSVTGYVPFKPRKTDKGIGSHGMFSATALNLVRESIFTQIDLSSNKKLPKKIYLSRGGRYRALSNEDAVEKCLTTLGFVCLKPETLSFIQQVSLLKNAEIVIGPTGASMANLLFSELSQSVFILIAKNPEMHYFYWTHMTSTVGILPSLVLGIQDHQKQGIHSSFRVDESHVLEALKYKI